MRAILGLLNAIGEVVCYTIALVQAIRWGASDYTDANLIYSALFFLGLSIASQIRAFRGGME